MDDHDEEKKTEQNLIVGSGKFEAEVGLTNNRRLCSTYCAIEQEAQLSPRDHARFVSLNILLSHSRSLKIIRNDILK